MLVNNFSNIISCQGTEGLKDTELRNQQYQSVKEIDSKPNNISEDERETSNDENNIGTRKDAKVSSDEHTDREKTDMPHKEEENADKTDLPVSSRRDSYAQTSKFLDRTTS